MNYLFLNFKRIFFIFLFLLTAMLSVGASVLSLSTDNLPIPKSESASLQSIAVTGKVTDNTGQPLPGVTVLIKGAAQGTATLADGTFNLQVPGENTILAFSYIGFVTQEVTVGNRRNISIMLQEETSILDEVVVVGYGTMRRRDLTGSIAQLKANVVANEAPRDVRDMLRGNVAGLNVGYSTGAKPGGGLEVRGRNSLTASSSPLLVLDGVIYYGGLEDINPADIETVDILKDASSAAVYGAKAASGVVVIMTRKGTQGKPQVNFNTSVGFVNMSVHMPVYDAQGYVKWRSDVAKSINVVKNTQNPGMYDDPRNLPSGVTQEQWLKYDSNDGDLLKTWFNRLYMQTNEL